VKQQAYGCSAQTTPSLVHRGDPQGGVGWFARKNGRPKEPYGLQSMFKCALELDPL
jgi:hypothetical protein